MTERDEIEMTATWLAEAAKAKRFTHARSIAVSVDRAEAIARWLTQFNEARVEA